MWFKTVVKNKFSVRGKTQDESLGQILSETGDESFTNVVFSKNWES